jgi:hypothetical protein
LKFEQKLITLEAHEFIPFYREVRVAQFSKKRYGLNGHKGKNKITELRTILLL